MVRGDDSTQGPREYRPGFRRTPVHEGEMDSGPASEAKSVILRTIQGAKHLFRIKELDYADLGRTQIVS